MLARLYSYKSVLLVNMHAFCQDALLVKKKIVMCTCDQNKHETILETWHHNHICGALEMWSPVQPVATQSLCRGN